MSADDRGQGRHDLGVCAILEAESVGPPGNRLFRLRAAAEYGSALLWLEKEQLYELALTVKRLLGTSVRSTGEPETSGSQDTRADHEFKVARLGLGYDRATGRYMILAQLSETSEDGAVAVWADRETLNRMADRALEVHDAGRPRCPLCGGPIVEGKAHVCPRAN